MNGGNAETSCICGGALEKLQELMHAAMSVFVVVVVGVIVGSLGARLSASGATLRARHQLMPNHKNMPDKMHFAAAFNRVHRIHFLAKN